MRLRNTTDGYGMISRLLHWLIAVGAIVMIGFGMWIEDMQPSLSNLWLFNLHKSVGLTIFALVLARLAWHRVSPVPLPLGAAGSWQLRLARIVHGAFYVLLLAMPLSGWVGSSGTGIDTVYFGLWTVPDIAPPVKAAETAGFAVHALLWPVLAAALILHVAGALRHGFGPSGALARMLGR